LSSDEQVRTFIETNFRSVWTLELLLLLKRERRHWTNAEMVAALRASELVVDQALQALMAGGLAIADEEGGSYAPATSELEQLADAAESFYLTKPDAVRRLIVASGSRGITAFADAFRLRKD
jgi:hypothetical protein